MMQPVDRLKKIEVSLSVAGRLHGEGSNGTGCHGIVVLLMGLYVFTILVLAVAVVIDCLAGDDGTRT